MSSGRRGASALGLAIAASLVLHFGSASAQDAREPLPRGTPPVPPDLAEKIHRAIEAGVARIRRGQAADGSFLMGPQAGTAEQGYRPDARASRDSALARTSLAIHTLLSCGVRANDPAIENALRRAWDWYREPEARKNIIDTYSVGLTLLALRSLRGDRPAQPPSRPDGVRPSATDLQRWAEELAAWIPKEARCASGGFSYGGRWKSGYDHSNTQYAILGLRAASEMGVEIPREVWFETLRHMLKAQERSGPRVDRFESSGVGESGYGWGRKRVTRAGIGDRARGWGYMSGPSRTLIHGEHPCTGSMTSAGVFIVAVCRDELRVLDALQVAEDRAAEQSIWDGLGWLGHNFSVEKNPGARDAIVMVRGGRLDGESVEEWERRLEALFGGVISRSAFHYYYLYSLERAGIASGAAWMGEHDWYREGAEYLVRAQMRNGLWNASELDTCFALLFLRRAAARTPRGAVTGQSALSVDPVQADALGEKDLRDAFDEVFRRLVEVREEASVREGLSPLVSLGPRVVPLLIRHLDGEDPVPRRVASVALAGITLDSPPFSPDADEAVRATQLQQWEEWWTTRGPTLRRDIARGVFTGP